MKLIRAIYDYDCVWNEWSNLKEFNNLKSDHESDYDIGYIFGEPCENEGMKFVKNEVRGLDEALKNLEQLQTDNDRFKNYLEKLFKGDGKIEFDELEKALKGDKENGS